MEHGRVVERGTYEELVDGDGTFAQLARQDAWREGDVQGPARR